MRHNASAARRPSRRLTTPSPPGDDSRAPAAATEGYTDPWRCHQTIDAPLNHVPAPKQPATSHDPSTTRRPRYPASLNSLPCHLPRCRLPRCHPPRCRQPRGHQPRCLNCHAVSLTCLHTRNRGTTKASAQQRLQQRQSTGHISKAAVADSPDVANDHNANQQVISISTHSIPEPTNKGHIRTHAHNA